MSEARDIEKVPTRPHVLDVPARTIRLSPAALKRLARLQARLEGATAVAQAAIASAQAAHQAAQASLQQALTEECQDEGLAIPAGGGGVDIDWRSGQVSLKDAPNGVAK